MCLQDERNVAQSTRDKVQGENVFNVSLLQDERVSESFDHYSDKLFHRNQYQRSLE